MTHQLSSTQVDVIKTALKQHASAALAEAKAIELHRKVPQATRTRYQELLRQRFDLCHALIAEIDDSLYVAVVRP